MTRILLIALTILGVSLASAATAANRSTQTWEAVWEGGDCVFDLVFERDGFDGVADARRGCGKLLRKARSFQYPTPDRSVLVLFSRKKGRGRPLAIFSRLAEGEMQATVGKSAVAIRLVDQTNLRDLTLGAKDQTRQATCLTYANSAACAQMSDVENPPIPAYGTMKLKALANMKIFPFSGGKGIAVPGSLAKGQCYIFKQCERAFNSTFDWCEFALEDGSLSGWVLRRDADHIYLRPDC